MSIEHYDAVLAHSRAEGSARLVMLALAHRMNPATHFAWPSIDLLMHETRLSERAIRGAFTTLVQLGELTRDTRDGNRGFSFTLQCPDGCAGDRNHARNLSELRTTRRAHTTARKRAQRATPPTPLEAPVEELSLQNMQGQTTPRNTNRTVVPAKSAYLSLQNLQGQTPDTSLREPERLTTTTKPASRNGHIVEAGGEDTPPARPGGETPTINDLVTTARAVLPRQLVLQITVAAFTRALQPAHAKGLTSDELRRALHARSFDGAGPGAVITFLRELEPLPEPTANTTHCPIHGDDTTRRTCQKCANDARQRAIASGTAKQPGETIDQWLKRLNITTA